MCDKYNGWSNYQTWVFNLWFDDYFTEEAELIYKDSTDANEAIHTLSGTMKMTVEELNPIGGDTDSGAHGVYSDLMGHAIGMIDFYEVAEHYIDELV